MVGLNTPNKFWERVALANILILWEPIKIRQSEANYIFGSSSSVHP